MRSVILAAAFGLLVAGCQAAPEPDKISAAAQAATPEPEARIPEGPGMKAERVEISETPCRTAIGETASARLVERCLAVSPATRPPCNAVNPCDLIQGEIDRSCNQYGPEETRPKECVG